VAIAVKSSLTLATTNSHRVLNFACGWVYTTYWLPNVVA